MGGVEREPRPHEEAAFRLRAALEEASDHGDPLAHTDETVTFAAFSSCTTIVGDLELEFVAGVAHDDAGAGRASVLERVRQSLLDDAVSGDVDARRQRSGVALDPQPDGHTGLAHILDQPVEMPHARLRRQRQLVVAVAQDAEQPAHLNKRLPPRRLDRAERLANGRLIALELPLGTLSLNHDDADGVRHDVVQLSRDARAFFGDGKPSLLLSLALEQVRAAALRCCLEAPAAQSPADEPGTREHDQRAKVDTVVAREGAEELAGDEDGKGDGSADKGSTSL